MHIYYPSDAVVYYKNTPIGGPVTEQYIGVQPDTIFVLSGSTNFTSSLTASSALNIPIVAVNPTGSAGVYTGSMVYYPTENKLYVYNGTNWKSASFA